MDTMNCLGKNGELGKVILDEYMKGFQERNPNLYVFSAHLHMDEQTPIFILTLFLLLQEVKEDSKLVFH